MHSNAARCDTLSALVQAHFDKVLASGLDCYGPDHTAMWMASLDTATGRYPIDDTRPEHIGKRVYRNIDAPKGCSLYWDQPAVVAAHALSRCVNDERYVRAADAYVRDFLKRCVASNGIFLWGNHYYYDAFRDVVMRFKSREDPIPCDPESESGELHEIRPIVPAWETFWRVDPHATDRAIRAAAAGHLVNADTGEFDRHAGRTSGCAFIEHGATMIESLAWLYAKTGDPALLEPARAMARFSFEHRHPNTGLLENNPTVDRWDKTTSTTEAGLWAGCLVRAAGLANEPAWIDMADAALSAWLAVGYDENAGRYYGRLRVADGTPIFDPPQTPYEPGNHADLWRPLFPAHDYPMQCAEAALSLYQLTSKPTYRTACERWHDMIDRELPARNGQGGYAEHYGRCLHFLLGCHTVFDEPAYLKLAHRIANEAVTVLFAQNMFRSHPGEDRYDAVDGVGFLLLGLLWLERGEEVDAMGLGW
ncbi:hypothetical protein ACERK3_04970 [Phycisphaerales bacterium AB-hyl4]|uniref:Uncharacterized protein n=1 Tax=Natronomicrosphaera hydrolytica TaxID=3242702 RepID=A0ABV4U476_9BACT